MRLGTETGSLINHMMSSAKDPELHIGMDATELLWTDRHAYRIVQLSEDKKRVTLCRLKAIPKFKGMTDSQDYDYEMPEPGEGYWITIVLFRGKWYHFNTMTNERHGRIEIKFGVAMEYYDFSY